MFDSMIHPKRLSIILAAHNSGKYLKGTLASLVGALGEAANQCEIILVNDASEDDTESLLQAFCAEHPSARYYNVHYKNIGKVRNFAIGQSVGEYITIVDSDDLLIQDAFIEILQFLQKAAPDILITKLNEAWETSFVKRYLPFSPIKLRLKVAIKNFLMHKAFQAHFAGKFIKRSLLKHNPFPDFCCYEDAYLFPKILKQSQTIYYSRGGPYLYIKRKNSLSNQITQDKISLLIAATKIMESEFGLAYRHLILRHWLDIFLKYQHIVANPIEKSYLFDRIASDNKWALFLDFGVRLSTKRKFSQALFLLK